MKKKEYITPTCEVIKVAVTQMLASSITGSAPDSDDSEFGVSARRSEGWEYLW